MSDYIPAELIPNIIARLPVNEVLRCTSVCKSWYSLITSPSFASFNLNLTSPNQEPRLLVEYCKTRTGYRTYCLHRDNQTYDEIAELDPPCVEVWGWRIIDCFNGLFCLHDYAGRIVLWNPSLRKSFFLPNYGLVFSIYVVGFAYLSASNDYKIVKLSCGNKSKPQALAEIYQFSTGCWRKLENVDCPYSTVYLGQAHLNGIIHWHARDFENWICSFDMKTEKFGSLMVPSGLHDNCAIFTPFTFRETLSLVDDTHRRFCDVWVMEYGVAESWEKLFVLDKIQHGLNYFKYLKNNGELLFGRAFKPSTRKTEFVSYDCNTNRVKYAQAAQLLKNHKLGPYEEDNRVLYSIHTYVESLVLIKSPNEVKIDEELRFGAESSV